MTNSSERSCPVHARSGAGPSPQAALFAALFQALEGCGPDVRGPALKFLETRLPCAPDDLEKKFSLLLDRGAMPSQDRIYSLWLLYLSMFSQPQPRPEVQAWIGPDLFSDDQQTCLRLRGMDAELPGPKTLEGELTILAQAVHKKAVAVLRRTGPQQLAVTVRNHDP